MERFTEEMLAEPGIATDGRLTECSPPINEEERGDEPDQSGNSASSREGSELRLSSVHALGKTQPRRDAKPIMAGAKGVYIWDTEGRMSLDGFGGLYCVNMGWMHGDS